MSRTRDMHIVWIVLLALVFWAAAWNHDTVLKLWRMASAEAGDLLKGARIRSSR